MQACAMLLLCACDCNNHCLIGGPGPSDFVLHRRLGGRIFCECERCVRARAQGNDLLLVWLAINGGVMNSKHRAIAMFALVCTFLVGLSKCESMSTVEPSFSANAEAKYVMSSISDTCPLPPETPSHHVHVHKHPFYDACSHGTHCTVAVMSEPFHASRPNHLSIEPLHIPCGFVYVSIHVHICTSVLSVC